MKFSKIVLALLLILAITATLFACSPTNGNEGGDPAGDEIPGGTENEGNGNGGGETGGETGGESGGESGGNTSGGQGDKEPTGTFEILYQRTSAGKCVVAGFTGKGEGEIVIPETYSIAGEICTVVGINAGAFRNCKYITAIVIPDTVATIGLGAFEGCIALESLTVPFVGGTATSNTFIGYVFGGETFASNAAVVPASLTSVTVNGVAPVTDEEGNVQRAGASSIASFAFDSCASIESVTIGQYIKSIGAYAFARCSITVIDLPDSVISVGIGAYVDCPVEEAVVPFVGADNTGAVGYLGHIFGASSYSQNKDFVPATLKKISVSEGCTVIGDGAFNDCTVLEEIDLPTTIISIGENAFANTPYLNEKPDGLVYIDRILYTYKGELGDHTDIIIAPGTIAIAGGAFANLPITSISIPETVISIGAGAFRGSVLTEIALPFLGENSTTTTNNYLGYIFGASSADENAAFVPATLKTVTLYDGCQTIGARAFYGCDMLTAVNVGSGVTAIAKDAFFACTSLSSITVSAGNTAYKNDNALVYNMAGNDLVAVPMAITGSITLLDIQEITDGQFRGCVGITSIVLPDTLVRIGKEAFSGIENLTDINFPDALASVGRGAFDGTGWYGMQPDGVVYTGNVLYKFKGESGERVTIPNTVTGIAAGAFENCNFISVEIPASVTNIGEGAFTNCRMESLTIPFIGADATGTNSPFLGYLFGAPSSVVASNFVPQTLKSVTLLDTCTRIGAGAFDGCASIEELLLPENVTYIAGGALHQTAWFAKQEPGVLYIGRIVYTFIAPEKTYEEYEEEIKKQPVGTENPIVNPYDVVLREDTVAIADKAFQSAAIRSIRIPDTTTYIGSYAFGGCKSLTSVRMPSYLTTLGEYAFYDCSSLSMIYIPGTIVNIPKNAFYQCRELRTVNIDAGIRSVGEFAFSGCQYLSYMNFAGTLEEWLDIDFTSGNEKLTGARYPMFEYELENDPFDPTEK